MGALVCLVLSASGASAATLNVVEGQLVGATGVIVDGSSYDVAFLDGTCIALFSGCNSAADFTFQSEAAARLASQALLDQVFLDGADSFDSNPGHTATCTVNEFMVCLTYTPFFVNAEFGFLIDSAAALNDVLEDFDRVFLPDAESRTTDFSIEPTFGYAVWTPVPEPSTAILMGLGLLALSVRSRRQG